MDDPIEACALQLARLRGSKAVSADLPTGLPDPIRPATLAAAYRVQDRLIGLWPDQIAGWKVGATSKEIQALFGVAEPVYGPVFGKTISHSPARIPAATYRHRMLEVEFAFRFGQALSSRGHRYSREEIVAAVSALHPAFEILDPRFTTLTVEQIPQLVADCCGNGGAVLGPECRDWRGLDLAAHAVVLSIGGTVRQRGTGALVLGHPLNVLDWFVNHMSERGLGIAAGQLVLTGTMTGIHSPAPGETARADFGSLGVVEIAFDAS